MSSRLSWRQKVVLGEIVWGTYDPERRDTRTLRSLERRGFIQQSEPPAGVIYIRPRWEATPAGKAQMAIEDERWP